MSDWRGINKAVQAGIDTPYTARTNKAIGPLVTKNAAAAGTAMHAGPSHAIAKKSAKSGNAAMREFLAKTRKAPSAKPVKGKPTQAG